MLYNMCVLATGQTVLTAVTLEFMSSFCQHLSQPAGLIFRSAELFESSVR